MPTFREHVQADTDRWSPELRAVWREVVDSNAFGEWAKYPKAEVELRAWLEIRGPIAVEPVVLNRHHLLPQDPQPLGSAKWPREAIYCGRAPTRAPALDRPGGEVWRFAHLLGNPYPKDLYADALERYRIDLRRWLLADRAAVASGGKRPPQVDAIRSLEPRHALVCSCVSSPWTPRIAAPAGQPLSPEVTCHCHLIVAAWRVLRADQARSDQPKTVAPASGG